MNIANIITSIRILLIPLFMFFLLDSRFSYSKLIAAAIFIIAAITDSLDGYIARSKKIVTNFGKFLDPLADKLLITAALVGLVELNKISSWIAMIIIGREFIVTGLRMVAAAEGVVISANVWGKLKTISQIIAIVLLLVDNYPFKFLNFPLDQIVLWIAVILTIYSGFDYIKSNWSVINFAKK
ncbi:CDP-diacylglycerol--glycerol-3-phosphate 3-phosphatidyltransferase [Caldicellulosiruptor morganii]|uniref:CDP-diacylglycerol--glycerol-3-phosphate 3-phosphatidyltransferase n=1 Tax=Caldicellulosiruptor morganii TaxID=1387555 RepID=A0ABY7BQM8_9FIRM|nr:CDP-diacylglycerol--glycerol-3-phosphate 3-phosphatidyltransferase [Caldicellulosiruptor morganii]WAM34738.1 CDP-diacylglycerol--glycerol-3-phosphate 3-phosphatidyltransferase [Caldicellulosiruptor morganii]